MPRIWQQAPHAWALRHRRGQLLGALDVALRSLSSVDEALAAWRRHSGSAESALLAIAGRPQPAAAGGAKSGEARVARLRHFLELRSQWLALSGDQAAAVGRLAQAVLHFELSRCGPGSSWLCSIRAQVARLAVKFRKAGPLRRPSLLPQMPVCPCSSSAAPSKKHVCDHDCELSEEVKPR